MLSNELMNYINNGNEVLVEINKCYEDFELRYEEGMKAYIVKAIKDNIGICFKTSEKEFTEYNKLIEKPLWLNDKTGLYELKWSELKQNVTESDYYIWEDVDNEIFNFKIINSDEQINLYERFINEKSNLSYIKWLENKVI